CETISDLSVPPADCSRMLYAVPSASEQAGPKRAASYASEPPTRQLPRLLKLPAPAVTGKQTQLHRFAHGVVARGARMNAVPAVERRVHEIRVRWIAHNSVEVDHGIERRFRADPLVDLVPDPGFVRVPSRVGSGGCH